MVQRFGASGLRGSACRGRRARREFVGLKHSAGAAAKSCLHVTELCCVTETGPAGRRVRCQEIVLKKILTPSICKGGAPSAVCLRARGADCSRSVPVMVLVAFIAKELRGRNRRAGGKGGASRAPRVASARMRSGKQGVQPAERGGLAHATRARRCRALDEHARGMRSITALSRLQAWGNRAPLTGATGLLCECLIATWVVGNGVRKSAHAAQRKAGQKDRRC